MVAEKVGSGSSFEWLALTVEALTGLFAGIFVGCLALAIAEMLDSIPILTRRIGFRHGLGLMVLSIAMGKAVGSLLYFWHPILFFGKNSVINDGSCSRFRFGKEQLMENYQTDQSFQKQYEKYVKQVTPTHNLALQMLHAFVTGGAICTVGQIILNVAKSNGLDDAAAGSVCAILLVLASALLTGFNIYPSLVKWGGAGALVPITGFANSVASSAIEYKAEGQVFGIGCKIFTIAGPVILYGILSSWILGVIYYLFTMIP